jgi:hypothetical protein
LREDLPTQLHPLVTGLAATAVAVLAIASWSSLGAFFVRSIDADDPAWLPSTILVGSALSSMLLAIATRSGLVIAGVLLVAAIGILALAVRLRRTLALPRNTMNEISATIAGPWSVGALILGLIAWIYAIAPPRDADAMRYHLAHLRQIISDGQWQPIADFHYAIPFAWTLNFLPFELIGLPQAAQLTNLLILIVICITFLRIARNNGQLRWGLLLTALFATHPLVVRTFTSATADGYAVFVLFLSGVLLLRLDRISPFEAALLGFAVWVGAGSRYQLLVWGAIVTVLFAWSVRGRTVTRALMARFAAGAGGALLLASPFYLANLAAFRNPVWPLLVSREAADASYASAVARGYAHALVAGFSPHALAEQLTSLLRLNPAFPIAIAIFVLCIVGLLRGGAVRVLSLAGLVFSAFWIESWPVLFPRLVLPVLGVALLIALHSHSKNTERKPPIAMVAIAMVGVLGMTAATAYAGIDYVTYAVTGDAARFHRYTWYYDLYNYVNHRTPRNARFLVVVYSGHSYYLDRPYRRADPWLSGVVDWRHVGTGKALDSVLTAGRYDGMIYDLRDWKAFIGGSEMMRAVPDAIRSGYLIPDTVFHERLYTSRVSARYDSSDVLLLRRPRR